MHVSFELVVGNEQVPINITTRIAHLHRRWVIFLQSLILLPISEKVIKRIGEQ